MIFLWAIASPNIKRSRSRRSIKNSMNWTNNRERKFAYTNWMLTQSKKKIECNLSSSVLVPTTYDILIVYNPQMHNNVIQRTFDSLYDRLNFNGFWLNKYAFIRLQRIIKSTKEFKIKSAIATGTRCFFFYTSCLLNSV